MMDKVVGDIYRYEDLSPGDMVAWYPKGESDSCKWVGMICRTTINDPLHVMWFDGDLNRCENWSQDGDTALYMYLGRLPNNVEDFLNPSSN